MPQLIFDLTELFLRFSAEEKSEEWSFQLIGKCVPSSWKKRSFTLFSGDNSWDGYRDNETIVSIERRPPRSEMEAIPASKPFDKIDSNRDSIHATCWDASEPPIFQLSIYLPPDAYERLREVDWTKESVRLIVNSNDYPIDGDYFKKEGLIYGIDPDGNEIEWYLDNRPREFLESITFHFSTDARQKVTIQDQPPQDNALAEKTLAAVEQTLNVTERISFSIGEFRASMIKIAWVLVIVLAVTAFIR